MRGKGPLKKKKKKKPQVKHEMEVNLGHGNWIDLKEKTRRAQDRVAGKEGCAERNVEIHKAAVCFCVVSCCRKLRRAEIVRSGGLILTRSY